jgi:SanA protein
MVMARTLARTLKTALKWGALLLFLGLALILGCDAWVARTAKGHCHTSVAAVPAMPVGLVLGTSPRLRGGIANPFFTARIQAAVELYKAAKVRALIVSGDNSTKIYDEPTAMKAALIEAGVPEGRIYCDYAGFRTLDSVVRAQAIFGQSRFLIISQRFHNERAVFLAQRHGLEAEAFNARDVPRTVAPTTFLREYLARVQAVLDVMLLNTKPKFYGPLVKIE